MICLAERWVDESSDLYCRHLAASAKLDITNVHEFLSATRPDGPTAEFRLEPTHR